MKKQDNWLRKDIIEIVRKEGKGKSRKSTSEKRSASRPDYWIINKTSYAREPSRSNCFLLFASIISKSDEIRLIDRVLIAGVFACK